MEKDNTLNSEIGKLYTFDIKKVIMLQDKIELLNFMIQKIKFELKGTNSSELTKLCTELVETTEEKKKLEAKLGTLDTELLFRILGTLFSSGMPDYREVVYVNSLINIKSVEEERGR